MLQGLLKKIGRAMNGADNIVKREVMPFSLDINVPLRIDTNIHVIYKSRFSLPTFNTVTAIGQFRFGDAKIYRFYVGDNHYLQCITDLFGALQECRMYTIPTLYYPSTPETWLSQINIRGGSGKIGMASYEYCNDEYLRMASWAEEDPDWVRPIDFFESIEKADGIFSSTGHQAMCYGKWLNEDKRIAEYLIVSSETRKNSEGRISEEVISYAIGIDINPSEVKVF